MARYHALPPALLVFLCLLPGGALVAAPGTAAGSGDAPLATYSDAKAEWGSGVEALIENAFRQCSRTYIVSGKVITLRVPFAQDQERSELAETELTVTGNGKADPASIWAVVDQTLSSADFQRYLSALEDGREKMVTFDLERRSWSANLDWYEIDWMKSGVYLGLPHLIDVVVKGRGVTVPAVYDYLYSVSRVGMDCSGFVWWVLKSVARAGGLDLDAAFRWYLGAPTAATVPLYVGAWFFDPRNRYVEEVKDQIRNLQPGDAIGFRGADGNIIHSAVIQSVDLAGGTIRYLQSTDEAPQEERGVHESTVSFDPANPEVSLKDPSLIWHQRNAAPFVGEVDYGFRNDGERYRARQDKGGGVVVRIKALKQPIDRIRAAAAKR
jgi:cell wall-associated NlpC family hydrolase